MDIIEKLNLILKHVEKRENKPPSNIKLRRLTP